MTPAKSCQRLRASLATNARPTWWAIRSHWSCCLLDRRQRCEVELVRGSLVQRRLRSVNVVEADVARWACLGVADRLVGIKVVLLVLDRTPQPFHEDVVSPAPRPSMLISIPRHLGAAVKALLVNWLP